MFTHNSPKLKHPIKLKSTYEKYFCEKILDVEDDVVSYSYETIKIPYQLDGKWHKYCPDFLVLYKNNDKKVIEVKSTWWHKQASVAVKRVFAEKYCQERGMIYEYTLVAVARKFLNYIPDNFYTIDEFKMRLHELGIKSYEEYTARWKEDPKFVWKPQLIYHVAWKDLCENRFYATLKAATLAVHKLQIGYQKEYYRRYGEDPNLPCCPDSIYKKEWTNWNDFLYNVPSRFYETLMEAKIAISKLDIKTSAEYRERCIEDPKLPHSPQFVYKNEWSGWQDFIGISTPYTSFKEVKEAIKRLGIKSHKEYENRFKEDPRLRGRIINSFRNEWKGWGDIFGYKIYPTLKEAKKAAQDLGFKSQAEYCRNYRKGSKLPIHPARDYKKDWISWNNFLGLE